MLVLVGYDPALEKERIQVTTGSGVEFVPRLTIVGLALWVRNGRDSRSSLIRCRQALRLTDYWGLDFLRGQRVVIDSTSKISSLIKGFRRRIALLRGVRAAARLKLMCISAR